MKRRAVPCTPRDKAQGALRVSLKLERERGINTEQFMVDRVETQDGKNARGKVKLQLNTLSNVALGESSYWLDSGSIFRV